MNDKAMKDVAVRDSSEAEAKKVKESEKAEKELLVAREKIVSLKAKVKDSDFVIKRFDEQTLELEAENARLRDVIVGLAGRLVE